MSRYAGNNSARHVLKTAELLEGCLLVVDASHACHGFGQVATDLGADAQCSLKVSWDHKLCLRHAFPHSLVLHCIVFAEF